MENNGLDKKKFKKTIENLKNSNIAIDFYVDISTKEVNSNDGTTYYAWDVSSVTDMDNMFKKNSVIDHLIADNTNFRVFPADEITSNKYSYWNINSRLCPNFIL